MLSLMAGRRTITDPRVLRAMAHPKRWAIFDVLFVERTATATRCAELTGESVASCSYHLGILGKYGLVEQVGGSGREKPWRMVDDGMKVTFEDVEEGGELAVEMLSEVEVDHVAEQIKAAVRRQDREGPQWRPHAGTWDTVTYLTPDELAGLAAEFQAIVDRLKPRGLDPSARPSGSRAVRVFLSAWLPRPPEEVVA